MESPLSVFFTLLLAAISIVVLLKLYTSEDKSKIWMPITFITLSYLYYTVIPMFNTSRDFEGFNTAGFTIYFHLGALISYLSVLLGFFAIAPNRYVVWSKWNNCINVQNIKRIAIILFVFALICYVPVRGFKFSVLTSSSEMIEYDWDNQGLNYYFVGAISLFIASCSILLIKFQENKLLFFVLLWLTLVTYIVSGFRYRIVILVISMFTMYYLYNKNKKLQIIPLITLAIICYLGFNIMDHARSYGNGISADVIQSMSSDDLVGKAGETERVYNYSVMVMKRYEETGMREYFAPLINAICMPIPRSVFPWKPKAEYMYNATSFVMNGGDIGSAYVNFVEAFMAFGWLGIIINGVFFGWLSRAFWNNFRYNQTSVGAILALGIFNGFTYVVVSRGYLAQQLNVFLFFVCLPFWIVLIYNKLNKIK